MSHSIIYPQEHKMVAFSRRPSTFSEKSSSEAECSTRRPSIADTRRKSSLSSLSLRLTRSKRSRSSSSVTCEEANRLGTLFFSLPAEIQSLVLSHLPLPSLFSLRLTSPAALFILHHNAPSITRSVLTSPELPISHSELRYIQSLYPPPIPHTSTNYLLQILHRHHAIKHVIATIVNFIQMKIYMIRTQPRIEHFAPYRDGLSSKLYLVAWTTYHYLESCRTILVHEHPRHNTTPSPHDRAGPIKSKFWTCQPCQSSFTNLVNTYPASQVLPAYHFCALLLAHLRASSRAPTYAGTIERKLRGWSRKPPTEEELSILVVLGGIERMAGMGFSVMRGTYNQRLEVVGGFVDGVQECAQRNGGREVKHSLGEKGTSADTETQMKTCIQEIGTPYECITPSTLDSLPHLDDFVMREFQRRILEENLLERLPREVDESELEMERQRELAGPFGFVRRLMEEVDEEREREGTDDGEGGRGGVRGGGIG